jgi:hypothetical protein
VLCCDLKLDVSCHTLLAPAAASWLLWLLLLLLLVLGVVAAAVAAGLLLTGKPLCRCQRGAVCCGIKRVHAVQVQHGTCKDSIHTHRNMQSGQLTARSHVS